MILSGINPYICISKLSFVLLIIMASPILGESGTLARFVAPTYPPLARQAMISGTVGMTLTVGIDGKLAAVKVDSSSHALLTQEAESAVRQWEFHPWSRQRPVSVVVYFGFSGDTRESNPRTVIKAEFYLSTIRVFVTTDGFPAVMP